MMILDDIINADASINSWYRESSLPKPIKKIIAQYNRKKLKKSSLKYNGLVLEYNDIISFLVTCMRMNPPDGAYMYIRKIVEYKAKGETHYAVSMLVTKDDKESKKSISYTIDMMDDKEETMDIKITVTSDSGKYSTHTTRSSLEVQTDGDEYTEFLIDNCNDMFIHMILQMLDDVFDRSERIYDI